MNQLLCRYFLRLFDAFSTLFLLQFPAPLAVERDAHGPGRVRGRRGRKDLADTAQQAGTGHDHSAAVPLLTLLQQERRIDVALLRGQRQPMDRRFFSERIAKIIEEADF